MPFGGMSQWVDGRAGEQVKAAGGVLSTQSQKVGVDLVDVLKRELWEATLSISRGHSVWNLRET